MCGGGGVRSYLCTSMPKPTLDNTQMLLYVVFVRRQPCHVDEARLGPFQVTLLHVDDAQVVSSLHVLRLHVEDPAEARLGCRQVAVVVDVDVAHQDQTLGVVRMML